MNGSWIDRHGLGAMLWIVFFCWMELTYFTAHMIDAALGTSPYLGMGIVIVSTLTFFRLEDWALRINGWRPDP